MTWLVTLLAWTAGAAAAAPVVGRILGHSDRVAAPSWAVPPPREPLVLR